MLVAILAALALLLAACGSDSDDDGAEDTGTEDTAATDTGTTDDEGTDDGEAVDGSVTFALIPWDEDIAVTHLWKVLLEERDVDVDIEDLDPALAFEGLAQGDVDVFLDGWLPNTHASYWEEHEGDIESLSEWYDQAVLTLAVPEYVDIDTIADLADAAGDFDSRIIGIEPGAGHMAATADDVMPGYGLDDFELVESSTPGMLTELETAIDNEENIVVTLWRPHWAYDVFPIKDLEDTDGLYGEAETIHALANSDWVEANPVIAGWFENFILTDEELASLEDVVLNQYPDDHDAGVREWLEDADNRAAVDAWFD